MKLTKIAAATFLALSSLSASAASLNSLSPGYVEWKLTGFTTEHEAAAYAAGDETTWGFGAITNMTNGLNNVWVAGDNSEYLYYYIYGIADLTINPNGSFGNSIYNIGATGGTGPDGKIHIDVYKFASSQNLLTATHASRADFDTFTPMNTGALYLALELVPGGFLDDGSTGPDESTSTLLQDVTAATLPATGTGTFYAEAVAGSAKDQWDSNGYLLGGADFFGKFTLAPTEVGTPAFQTAFPGAINDPIKSEFVPEPSILALLGLGLLGLGVTRRKAA